MAARYWRLVGWSAYSRGDLELGACHLYASGARVDAGAVVTCSHVPAAGSLAAIQDDDPESTCRFAAQAVRSAGFAVRWDFGAPAEVDAVHVGAAGEMGVYAAGFDVQTSDDGATWITRASVGRVIWPGPRQVTAVSLLDPWRDDWVESFETGIPAGFADTLVDGGALTTAWEPGTQSVLATATGYNTAWMPVRGYARRHAGMEFDFEQLADYGLNCIVGIVFQGGPVLLQAMVSLSGGEFMLYASGSASTLGTNTLLNSTPFIAPAGRKTLRIVSVPNQAGGGRVYTVSIGASTLSFAHTHTSADVPLKCGVFLRSIQARIHSIRALKPGYLGTDDPPVHASPACGVAVAVTAPVDRLSTAQSRALVARDTEFGGAGRISGTVKRDADPTDVPLHRRVRLHREVDGLMTRETWSDATTGAYRFDGINEAYKYTVITYDHLHDYRAVIADNIAPELLP